jgi:hypothetical protein
MFDYEHRAQVFCEAVSALLADQGSSQPEEADSA